MAFDRPLLFGIQPTWGEWVGEGPQTFDSQMLAKLAEARCQLARVDSGWDKVWGGDTEPPSPNWTETDHEVQTVQQAGITPLIWLTIVPKWARSDPNDENSPPIDSEPYITKFINFHQAIAERYKNQGVIYFEFENETNSKAGWAADTLGKWLLRARQGLLAGNASVILIAGSTWPSDSVYLNNVYSYCDGQGVPFPFGAVAVHPYPGDGRGSIDLQKIRDYRTVMDNRGDLNGPIWVTEYGWG